MSELQIGKFQVVGHARLGRPQQDPSRPPRRRRQELRPQGRPHRRPRRPEVPRPGPARVPRRPDARPRQPHQGLRPGDGQGLDVSRPQGPPADRVRQRQDAGRLPAHPAADAGAGLRARGRRHGPHAPPRRLPQRPQAEQHPAQPGRRREDHRLRPGPHQGRDKGPHSGNARVHRAGAGQAQDGQRAHRHLQLRRHHVPDADVPAAAERVVGGGRRPAHRRQDVAAAVQAGGRVQRPGAGRPVRAGPPLPVLRGRQPAGAHERGAGRPRPPRRGVGAEAGGPAGGAWSGEAAGGENAGEGSSRGRVPGPRALHPAAQERPDAAAPPRQAVAGRRSASRSASSAGWSALPSISSTRRNSKNSRTPTPPSTPTPTPNRRGRCFPKSGRNARTRCSRPSRR